MKNNLNSLSNYLFEQIERINDDELKGEELDVALKKLEGTVKVGQTIINIGELALKAQKLAVDDGVEVKLDVPLLGITEKSSK